MTKRFEINGEPFLDDLGTHLIGVCYTDISLGQKFTKLESHIRDFRRPDGTWGAEYNEPIAVDLTVIKIVFWQKEFETISRGLSAELIVSGELSALVRRGVLSD